MKPGLMSVDEALMAILARARPLPSLKKQPLLQALGCVLGEDQYSTVDVPPCDNSAMDGYALRFSDLAESGNKLPISQRIAAGAPASVLQAGTAARIFTGASMPALADTVVMQEDTELDGEAVAIVEDIKLGQHIRPRGQDIAAGSVVLTKGRSLQPQDIGLLASIGVTEVEVYNPLRVAIMSTGDELLEPGQPLGEGKIYNSNRYTLSALLMALGCEVIDGGIVSDDFSATCKQLESLAGQADLIVSSGGVSVGEEDHVKAAVETLGGLALWKLNIKPGKPLAFGEVKGTPFFGLPGNPTSVFVTFCLLARPFILASMGRKSVQPLTMVAASGFSTRRVGTRQEYLRVKVSHRRGQPVAERYANQSSGVLLSTSWANALAIIPPGKVIAEGDLIEVILMSELLH